MTTHTALANTSEDRNVTRKRSRGNLDNSDDDVEREDRTSEASNPFAGFFKRTKSDGDLDGLGLIPSQEAWLVDVEDLLAAQGFGKPPGEPVIRILCILGGIPVQYEVLCELALEATFKDASACIQPLALCPRSLPHLAPEPSVVPILLCPTSHFVRLGLLHPQGGGDIPLDSLVLLDAAGRRRLVIPFGWGPGQRILEEHGGWIIKERMTNALKHGVKAMLDEMQAPREQNCT